MAGERTKALQQYHGEVAKVTQQTREAFMAAEDVLTDLEDREARRSARTSSGQQRLEQLRG